MFNTAQYLQEEKKVSKSENEMTGPEAAPATWQTLWLLYSHWQALPLKPLKQRINMGQCQWLLHRSRRNVHESHPVKTVKEDEEGEDDEAGPSQGQFFSVIIKVITGARGDMMWSLSVSELWETQKYSSHHPWLYYCLSGLLVGQWSQQCGMRW